MKRQFRIHLTVHPGLIALSSFLVYSSVQGDSITAAGYQDNGLSGLSEIGSMKSRSALEVFDLDTETGAKSRVQQFTQRGPASFKGMSRDSGGTLWAVQDNRLVTINETTGHVTDIAILQDGSENTLDFPEIAFASGDILYGIAKSSSFITLQAGSLAVSPGFRLVTIDTETGLVSDTGLDIGGRYSGGGSNVAHGLVYDPAYGLIHLWNETVEFLTADKSQVGFEMAASSAPTKVEILDPVTPSVTPVPYIDDVIPPPPPLVDGPAAISGQFASGFQAVTGSGIAGGIRVFEADYMASTFAVQIVEDQMIGTYFTSVVETYLPVMGIGSSRAMEQTVDGEGFIIETDGELITFTPSAPALTDAPFASDSAWFSPTFSVFTSIGGYSPDFSSLATDPTTGIIYALGSNSAGSRMVRLIAGAEKGEIDLVESTTRGLFVIDRDGPATIELGDLDVEFVSPIFLPDPIKEKEKSSTGSFSAILTDVEAIAFDNTGALFGITYQGFLVTIDLSTGEVQEIPDVYLSNHNSKQLEFSPGDGKLYILSYNNSFDTSMIELTSVNRDGSELASTELSPELPMYNYPNSLVTLGNNSFLFSINFYGSSNLTEKGSAIDTSAGSQLFQLDENGNVSPNPVFVSSVFITAMTQGGGFAQPDVLIGPTSRKLTGNNRYNRNGKGQTISIRGKGKTLSGEFFAEVQNDGTARETFQIAVSGGKRGDKITCFLDSRNVTGAIRKGLQTSIEPGDEAKFRVTFSRKGGGAYRERFQFRATAEGSTDTGLARTALSAPKSGSLKPNGL